MIDIISKIVPLTQNQKEALAKQFVLFSIAILQCCQYLIKGFGAEDVFYFIQTNFCPDWNDARYVVSYSQKILTPSASERLKYINNIRQKCQFFLERLNLDIAGHEKSKIIVYMIMLRREHEFYDGYLADADYNLVDQTPIKIHKTDNKRIKIMYDQDLKELIIDLKLLWTNNAHTWTNGLIAPVTAENSIFLKNIFGDFNKTIVNIPADVSEIIWDNEELYIRINPVIDTRATTADADSKVINTYQINKDLNL